MPRLLLPTKKKVGIASRVEYRRRVPTPYWTVDTGRDEDEEGSAHDSEQGDATDDDDDDDESDQASTASSDNVARNQSSTTHRKAMSKAMSKQLLRDRMRPKQQKHQSQKQQQPQKQPFRNNKDRPRSKIVRTEILHGVFEEEEDDEYDDDEDLGQFQMPFGRQNKKNSVSSQRRIVSQTPPQRRRRRRLQVQSANESSLSRLFLTRDKEEDEEYDDGDSNEEEYQDNERAALSQARRTKKKKSRVTSKSTASPSRSNLKASLPRRQHQGQMNKKVAKVYNVDEQDLDSVMEVVEEHDEEMTDEHDEQVNNIEEHDDVNVDGENGHVEEVDDGCMETEGDEEEPLTKTAAAITDLTLLSSSPTKAGDDHHAALTSTSSPNPVAGCIVPSLSPTESSKKATSNPTAVTAVLPSHQTTTTPNRASPRMTQVVVVTASPSTREDQPYPKEGNSHVITTAASATSKQNNVTTLTAVTTKAKLPKTRKQNKSSQVPTELLLPFDLLPITTSEERQFSNQCDENAIVNEEQNQQQQKQQHQQQQRLSQREEQQPQKLQHQSPTNKNHFETDSSSGLVNEAAPHRVSSARTQLQKQKRQEKSPLTSSGLTSNVPFLADRSQKDGTVPVPPSQSPNVARTTVQTQDKKQKQLSSRLEQQQQKQQPICQESRQSLSTSTRNMRAATDTAKGSMEISPSVTIGPASPVLDPESVPSRAAATCRQDDTAKEDSSNLNLAATTRTPIDETNGTPAITTAVATAVSDDKANDGCGTCCYCRRHRRPKRSEDDDDEDDEDDSYRCPCQHPNYQKMMGFWQQCEARLSELADEVKRVTRAMFPSEPNALPSPAASLSYPPSQTEVRRRIRSRQAYIDDDDQNEDALEDHELYARRQHHNLQVHHERQNPSLHHLYARDKSRDKGRRGAPPTPAGLYEDVYHRGGRYKDGPDYTQAGRPLKRAIYHDPNEHSAEVMEPDDRKLPARNLERYAGWERQRLTGDRLSFDDRHLPGFAREPDSHRAVAYGHLDYGDGRDYDEDEEILYDTQPHQQIPLSWSARPQRLTTNERLPKHSRARYQEQHQEEEERQEDMFYPRGKRRREQGNDDEVKDHQPKKACLSRVTAGQRTTSLVKVVNNDGTKKALAAKIPTESIDHQPLPLRQGHKIPPRELLEILAEYNLTVTRASHSHEGSNDNLHSPLQQVDPYEQELTDLGPHEVSQHEENLVDFLACPSLPENNSLSLQDVQSLPDERNTVCHQAAIPVAQVWEHEMPGARTKAKNSEDVDDESIRLLGDFFEDKGDQRDASAIDQGSQVERDERRTTRKGPTEQAIASSQESIHQDDRVYGRDSPLEARLESLEDADFDLNRRKAAFDAEMRQKRDDIMRQEDTLHRRVQTGRDPTVQVVGEKKHGRSRIKNSSRARERVQEQTASPHLSRPAKRKSSSNKKRDRFDLEKS